MLQPHHLVAGRYRIVRHIASGGMGAVYEAEHVTTEARVALKVLLPQMLQVTAARRRFELEAKVSARVNSEHIVRVYDAGVDDDTGSPYLAMELLSGETLAARVKREGPFDAASALDVLRQLARGLDAAHGYRTAEGNPQPIVHRDLKPENLFLVRRSDGSSLVKIVDFGIAKVLSDATAVSREVRGTPLYMSYEQVAGEAVSPQTDVWALGLLAYFMLTGRSYWSSAGKSLPSTEALFAQILTLPLPRPSRRLSDDGITVSSPEAFDRWLLACLERDPARRYASAGAAVSALQRALDGGGPAPVRRRLGGHFGSRVTARYDLPAVSSGASVASIPSGASVTSVPPVASEDGREPQRKGHTLPLRLGALLAIVAVLAASATWGMTRMARREPGGKVTVASDRSAGTAGAGALEPALDAQDARGARTAPPPAPAPVLTPAPAANRLTPLPERVPQPPPPRAKGPDESSASTPAAAAPTAARSLSPPTPAAVPASRPPAPAPPPEHRTTPTELIAPARNELKEPRTEAAKPAPHERPATESACTTFDPYTGRCKVGE